MRHTFSRAYMHVVVPGEAKRVMEYGFLQLCLMYSEPHEATI